MENALTPQLSHPLTLEREQEIFFGALASLDEDGSLGDIGFLPGSAEAKANPDLKLGSEGNAVKNLQKDLAGVGYPVTQTGKYDADTVEAVEDFQTEKHLPVTGVYDKDTKKALNAALGKGEKTAQTVTDILQFTTGALTGAFGLQPKATVLEEEEDEGTGSSGNGEAPPTNWLLWGAVGLGTIVVVGGMIYFVTRE